MKGTNTQEAATAVVFSVVDCSHGRLASVHTHGGSWGSAQLPPGLLALSAYFSVQTGSTRMFSPAVLTSSFLSLFTPQ